MYYSSLSLYLASLSSLWLAPAARAAAAMLSEMVPIPPRM